MKLEMAVPEEQISPHHTVLVGLAPTVTAGLHKQILLGDHLTQTFPKGRAPHFGCFLGAEAFGKSKPLPPVYIIYSIVYIVAASPCPVVSGQGEAVVSTTS